MTEFVFETVSEFILFTFIPLFLTVATVWILWRAFEKIEPDEVKSIESFLTFVVVVVPFVMLTICGLTAIIHNEMIIASGGSSFLPFPPSSLLILTGAVGYIGLTMWLWSHWRKLTIRQ